MVASRNAHSLSILSPKVHATLFLLWWWRRRKRRAILAQPFPAGWEQFLLQNVPHYSRLDDVRKRKLQDAAQVFIAEKFWEGCNGLTVTEEMQVTIAGHASLLGLELSERVWDRLKTILIYTDDYLARESVTGPDGVVREGRVARHGEAWLRGPVILSWNHVLEGGRDRDGQNLILHEFAHQLDMRSGSADGKPPLHDARFDQNWQHVMRREYERLCAAVQRGGSTLLDPYGTESLVEFFAVCTECFFERPKELRTEHTELYDMLARFFGQNPAEGLEACPK